MFLKIVNVVDIHGTWVVGQMTINVLLSLYVFRNYDIGRSIIQYFKNGSECKADA